MFGGGPTRYREGGTRGGRDQFSWDSIKDDKSRDYYLGATEKLAGAAWYMKRGEGEVSRDEAMRRDELRAVQEQEKAAAMEAL